MDNLKIYNQVREVPKNAQKQITAGRLKGMTDINPQWRIQTLTETFGPCGIGWYIEETKREFVNGANDEICCFVDIKLYVKHENEWSKPIYGTGGSTFVAKESKGLYTSDEAVKMAYTDAISVACKQLGFGANVYWNKSDSKYASKENEPALLPKITPEQTTKLHTLFTKLKISEEAKQKIYAQYKVHSSKELTYNQAYNLIKKLSERMPQ